MTLTLPEGASASIDDVTVYGGSARDRLFDVYEAMLKELGKPYTMIEGEREQRLAAAVKAVDQVLGNRG